MGRLAPGGLEFRLKRLARWRDGALPGTAPGEACFVRGARGAMIRSDLDNGRLVWLVGMVSVKEQLLLILLEMTL